MKKSDKTRKSIINSKQQGFKQFDCWFITSFILNISKTTSKIGIRPKKNKYLPSLRRLILSLVTNNASVCPAIKLQSKFQYRPPAPSSSIKHLMLNLLRHECFTFSHEEIETRRVFARAAPRLLYSAL